MPATHRVDDRDKDSGERLQKIIERFEDAWRNGTGPSIVEFLPPGGTERIEALVELIPVDQERRFKAGVGLRLEAYLEQFPELSTNRDAVLELITAEYELGRRLGWPATVEVYCQRFPNYAAELGQLLTAICSAATDAYREGADRSPVVAAEVAAGRVMHEAVAPSRFGRYRVMAKIGAGTFGVVYKGHDEQLQRDVAIKVPHRQWITSPTHVDAYLAEARILARLDHPGIVPVYDFDRTDDGLCYLVSKFVNGSDLAQKIEQDRPALAESVQIIIRVAEALDHAHQKRLIHRDIKPANILLDANGRPVVADFGLALREEDFDPSRGFAGTPAYASPEQAGCEGHRIGPHSDVFSLGVVFYELLTGERPFRGASTRETLDQVRKHDPLPPRQLDRAIPKSLERICMKALSKRASDRYSIAIDLADELREWQAGTKSQPQVNVVQVEIKSPMEAAPAAARAELTSTIEPVIETHPHAGRVVPKGLRSFEATDAEFFLELLPGPRGRDGLPDSLRFWKRRIEETDADQTFCVGLLHGPSGCGKSSLVKAGLLPRLASHVTAIYLEATPDDTEARLRHGLYKSCPELTPGLGLADALARLRLRRGLAAGQKVLIVLDQFEQWLHAKQSDPDPELLAALRQCDGQRVQCLLLVRDDFWTAASRFLRDLDIRLVEGQNMALVDLFDLLHARKVLAEFGRAFGRLPENAAERSRDQEQFLDRAVAGLARDGKVIPVRLSLFAEMVKGRPWTPATLKEAGGAQGIGVTFLEETFSAATAPPQHRLHQKAARAVLKSLLPEAGIQIRGQMRSRSELLAASGYANAPAGFEELLRILDTELRLVTPTEPEGQWGDRETGRQGDNETRRQGDMESGTSRHLSSSPSTLDPPPSTRYYQLTHDYLVPAVQQWLTRKQRETRRGRAELRLAEGATLWVSRPQNRYLPVWWEWISILLFTREKDWSEPQRRMMAKATLHHGMQTGVLLAIVLVAVWTIVVVNSRRQALSLVDKIKSADMEHVGEFVAQLQPYRHWADPALERIYDDGAAPAQERLRAALALAPVRPDLVDFLRQQLLTASPEELLVIRDALRDHGGEVAPLLWSFLHDGGADSEQRMRAACALAIYDPENSAWDQLKDTVADKLVTENPLRVDKWKAALAPERDALLEPLANIFRDGKRSETDRDMAASLLADYAADRPMLLAELILDADTSRQYTDLFTKLSADKQVAAHLMRQELAKKLVPDPRGTDDGLARRQAQAGVTLAKLGEPETLRTLLQTSPDPRVRTWLIHRLALLGADPHMLVQLLEREKDAGVLTAALLGLGEFDEKVLPRAEREALTPHLLSVYQDHPDTGLHSAADWLLRRWGRPRDVKEFDQKAAAGRPAEGRRWFVNRHGNTLVIITKPELVQCGSPNNEEGRDPNDEALHRVDIDRNFAIATKKVTVHQFGDFWRSRYNKEFKRDAVSFYGPDPDAPVLGVTWYEAAMYCNWLSEQEGIPQEQWCYPKDIKEGMVMPAGYLSRTGYRLPTEAEWEYACRAGTVTRRPYGSADKLLGKYAWYRENTSNRAQPVGTLKPNDFGLFDALGNTSDWCQNRSNESDQAKQPTLDKEETGPITAKQRRLTRGGSFTNPASEIRSASRYPQVPEYDGEPIGIRVARTLP
jgi:serine/threonine protein kinase/formylglycine-generating enzyme required for sulfatase activity